LGEGGREDREQREFPADRRIDWLEIGKEY